MRQYFYDWKGIKGQTIYLRYFASGNRKAIRNVNSKYVASA